eukprot:CAMPEP_0185006364 /NCGR_PEP_ID=MMETSP1098-20130426/84390_1 /TAXON_ID=89044 /ORGANISM="Spumella elongata, Strain CCAP 955/1" /LENGTH=91 /DNA_ID=CAMNT_0027534515 /DNA_START=256 /DNA_END=528 /DNA_ORIENTATION=+
MTAQKYLCWLRSSTSVEVFSDTARPHKWQHTARAAVKEVAAVDPIMGEAAEAVATAVWASTALCEATGARLAADQPLSAIAKSARISFSDW